MLPCAVVILCRLGVLDLLRRNKNPAGVFSGGIFRLSKKSVIVKIDS